MMFHVGRWISRSVRLENVFFLYFNLSSAHVFTVYLLSEHAEHAFLIPTGFSWSNGATDAGFGHWRQLF